jgi:hypothetical protein
METTKHKLGVKKIPGTPVSSNKNWLQQYNWNIVESGIKHHNPNIDWHDRLNDWLLIVNIFEVHVFEYFIDGESCLNRTE